MLDKFLEEDPPVTYCRETRNRILLAVYAYAYEYEDDPLVSDGEFDILAQQINVQVATIRPDLDDFFREEFRSYTGQWIHRHPELDKVQWIYNHYFKKSSVHRRPRGV